MTLSEIENTITTEFFKKIDTDDLYELQKICTTLEMHDSKLAVSYLKDLKEINETAPVLKSVSRGLWLEFKEERNNYLHETYYKYL